MEKEKLQDFDQFAQDYKSILDKSLELGGEGSEYFTNYKALYVRRCIEKEFKGKILDFGCGIGLLSEVLLQHLPQASVDGYDVSEASITNVPQILKKQGHFTTDLNRLVQEYDLIVVANVLHHIEARQRASVISKLKQLVKNGGKIIIFEHNPFNPLTRKVVRESPLDKGVVLLPPTETMAHLKNAGFEARQLNYIIFFPKILSSLRWAEPSLSWLPLGAQYTAMAELKNYA